MGGTAGSKAWGPLSRIGGRREWAISGISAQRPRNTSGWPRRLQVQDFGDRFWVYALYDKRTDEFSQIGKAYGKGGQTVEDTGPLTKKRMETIDDETIDRVQKLGGKLLRPKTAVPKTAWYAVVEDPEGYIFAVYQHDAMAMPQPAPD